MCRYGWIDEQMNGQTDTETYNLKTFICHSLLYDNSSNLMGTAGIFVKVQVKRKLYLE